MIGQQMPEGHRCPEDKTALMPSTTGRFYCPKCKSLWEIRKANGTYVFSLWPSKAPASWKRNDCLETLQAGKEG